MIVNTNSGKENTLKSILERLDVKERAIVSLMACGMDLETVLSLTYGDLADCLVKDDGGSESVTVNELFEKRDADNLDGLWEFETGHDDWYRIWIPSETVKLVIEYIQSEKRTHGTLYYVNKRIFFDELNEAW